MLSEKQGGGVVVAFSISRLSPGGSLVQRRDTLQEAVALATAAGDLSRVTIRNMDTGEKIVGQQILELAKRLKTNAMPRP